jgi:hypothetical protein
MMLYQVNDSSESALGWLMKYVVVQEMEHNFDFLEIVNYIVVLIDYEEVTHPLKNQRQIKLLIMNRNKATITFE